MAEGISRQSLGISRIFSVQKQESPRAIWTASRKGQSQLGGGAIIQPWAVRRQGGPCPPYRWGNCSQGSKRGARRLSCHRDPTERGGSSPTSLSCVLGAGVPGAVGQARADQGAGASQDGGPSVRQERSPGRAGEVGARSVPPSSRNSFERCELCLLGRLRVERSPQEREGRGCGRGMEREGGC